MFIRIGKCNRCGKCCDPIRVVSVAYELEKRKIPFEFPDHYPCSHFHYDDGIGVCEIYDKRPQYCRDWPERPMDLFGYPECGYKFVWVEEDKHPKHFKNQ